MARFRQQLYCIIFFLITHYSMVAEAAPGENSTEVGALLKLENLNASTNVGPESTSSATVVLDPNSTGKMRRSRSTDLRDGPSILSSPPCNVTVLIPVDENEACCFPTSAAVGISSFMMLLIVCLLFICCICVVRAMKVAKRERKIMLREYEDKIEREKRVAAMAAAKPPSSYIIAPSQKRNRSYTKPKVGPILIETSLGAMTGLIRYFAEHPVLPDVDMKHRAKKIDVILMPQKFENGAAN